MDVVSLLGPDRSSCWGLARLLGALLSGDPDRFSCLGLGRSICGSSGPMWAVVFGWVMS